MCFNTWSRYGSGDGGNYGQLMGWSSLENVGHCVIGLEIRSPSHFLFHVCFFIHLYVSNFSLHRQNCFNMLQLHYGLYIPKLYVTINPSSFKLFLSIVTINENIYNIEKWIKSCLL